MTELSAEKGTDRARAKSFAAEHFGERPHGPVETDDQEHSQAAQRVHRDDALRLRCRVC